MIAWYVGVILFFFGEMLGIVIMAILAGGADKTDGRIKKTADAGTSTADRETVRKDYFL